jgi:hypothetical protein
MHPWIEFVRTHKWWGVIVSVILVAVLFGFWHYGGLLLIFSLVTAAAVLALWFTDHRRIAWIVAVAAVVLGLGVWGYPAYKDHKAKKEAAAAATATAEKKKREEAKPPAPAKTTPADDAKNDSWSNGWAETKDAFAGLPAKEKQLADRFSLFPKIGPGDSAYRKKNPLPENNAEKPSASARPGKQSDDDAGAGAAAPIVRVTPPIEIEPVSGDQGDLKIRLLGHCHISFPNEGKCSGYVAFNEDQNIMLVNATGKFGHKVPGKSFACTSLAFDGSDNHTKLLTGSRSNFSFTFNTVPSDMADVITFEVTYTFDSYNEHTVKFENVPIDPN